MKKQTPRQRAIIKALRGIIPLAPYADFEPIATQAQAKHMRDLLPVNAAFLATVAHIRHRHTDYDVMRDEGYDKDSARFFVAEDIDDVLAEWGSPRGLNAGDSLTDDPTEALWDALES